METTLFDATDYLKSEEAIDAFLEDAYLCGDGLEIADAEAEVARARVRWSLAAPQTSAARRRTLEEVKRSL